MNTTRIQARQLSLYQSQVVAGVDRIRSDTSLNSEAYATRALKRKDENQAADQEFAMELEHAINSLAEHH